MDKRMTWHVWYFVAAFVAVLLLQALWIASRSVDNIPYSQFQQMLKSGQIENVVVGPTTIYGDLKVGASGEKRSFVTTRVEPDIAAQLQQFGVRYGGEPDHSFLRDILSWIVPVILFFGLWMIVFRRFAEKQGLGGFMTVGRSKTKIYVETDTKVTFADVAGVDEAKVELQEIVGFLKEPKRYGRLGGRVPRGVLLVGPPGTGKTLLARAVAGEAAVPFFSISGAEFVELFVGVGAARVRDLFEQARSRAPAIIFIDELDALGRARAPFSFGGGNDEKEQTLNQLLAELDGFDPSTGLVLLAATNRPEILDPALLRAGRFDRQVLVDRPDKLGRVQILGIHLKKAKLAANVNAEEIAALTPGFSGADLANLVNEAALLATRRGGENVTMADFTAAVERIVAGLEKRNRLLNPRERQVVAYHEMGHALVALTLPGSDPVHKVSIIPRGIGSLGYTIQRPTEDRYLMSRGELENKMAVLLARRAAESLVFGELSTGAADDLVKATEIARAMATRYGMIKGLGQVTYDREQHTFLGGPPMPSQRDFSEETAREIDCAIRETIAAAFETAAKILRERRSILEAGAVRLLEQETLTESDLKTLVGNRPVVTATA
jgi:cell division protease FtsH